MPRITDFYLLDRAPMHCAAVRAQSKVETLPQVIGESYGKLGKFIGERGLVLSDIPHIAYLTMDMVNFSIEAAFPLRAPIEADGNILPSERMGGLYVECIFLGAYDGLGPVYEEMMQWIDANGYEICGPVIEAYFNGPNDPPEHLLTRISSPVRKK